MDLHAIIRFRELPDGQIIHIPAGVSLYQGHITLSYPEYTGAKEGMIPFYEAALTQMTESQINDVFHTLISTFTVIHPSPAPLS